jgi:Rrf2 family transcriptional regulator, iron-sulfur cluster assembly transcription factor
MGIMFSNKCELAIKAILYLSLLEKDNKISAQVLADKMGIMKPYASKVLKDLVTAGLISSQQGVHGGFYLDKNLDDILLIDIVKTIDGNGLFENCILGFPGCGTCEACPVHDIWGGIRAQIVDMLGSRSLAELKPKTVKKLLEMILGDSIKVPSWGCQG